MKHKILKKVMGKTVMVLAAIMMIAAPSFAKDVYLVAKEFTQSIDGNSVTMWGFAQAGAGFTGIGPASSPGPVIEIPPGDTVLRIFLRNDLPPATNEAVSIVIPGQFSSMSPRFSGNRMTSFTHNATPGNTSTYTWNNPRPGTYLYHSGSHASLQVHMGLYGAVKMDSALGNQAYPGISYSKEVILFYSEIDPALHGPTPASSQPLNYKPSLFLVNGKPFETGDPNIMAGLAGHKTLIRFINAGLKTHVPTLNGGYWSVVAEDGNPYTYPKEKYNVFLPAMKTMDVIWTPAAQGVYSVYDARHFLTTNQKSGGGMLANLDVNAPNVLVGPYLLLLLD